MKISKKELHKIIKEEIENIISETKSKTAHLFPVPYVGRDSIAVEVDQSLQPRMKIVTFRARPDLQNKGEVYNTVINMEHPDPKASMGPLYLGGEGAGSTPEESMAEALIDFGKLCAEMRPEDIDWFIKLQFKKKKK